MGEAVMRGEAPAETKKERRQGADRCDAAERCPEAKSGEIRSAGIARLFRQYSSLAPGIVGLACARSGIVVSAAGSYLYTDEGVFTDGAMALVFALFFVVAVVLFKTRFVFRKRLINVIAHVAVTLEFLGVLIMGVLRATGHCTFASRFILSALVSAAGMTAIAYWLRRARGASMSTAAVLVFSATFLSEFMVFATVFLPDGVRCLVVVPFVLVQLACIRWARGLGNASDLPTPTRADDYFAIMTHGATNRRFLAACVVGIVAVSLVIGFLRGFPDGTSVAFCMPTRIACFLLTEAACVAFLFATLLQRMRTMTVGIWVVMEFLAAFTLVLYTAFPGHLDVGAVTATLLNTLMGAFTYYIVLAFMSSGWRDPFYYAIAIWGSWIFSRAIGRFVLLNVMPMGHSHFTGTVISLMLLVATQVVFIKFIEVAEFSVRHGDAVRDASGRGDSARLCPGKAHASVGGADEAFDGAGQGVRVEGERAACEGVGAGTGTPGFGDMGAPSFDGADAPGFGDASAPGFGGVTCDAHGMPEKADRDAYADVEPTRWIGDMDAPRPSTLERLLGLDNDSAVADVQNAVMRHHARQMGEQFLLSDREVEVLALYASGMTQKRVAEELHISQTTAHTHIGRIYSKTGLHSRQEILDYFKQYGGA